MGKNLKGKELGIGLRQREDGRYEARSKINGININLYNFDLEELKLYFNQAKETARKNLDERRQSDTLNQWFEEWFDKYKTPNIKVTSICAMKRVYYRVFGNRIGDMTISEVRNIDIQSALNDSKKAGIAGTSMREALGRLRECLESAKNNHIVNSNPCFDIVVTWPKKTKLRRFLSQQEQNKFLKEAEHSWYKEMFYTMFLTGMRIGEVGALTWDDIDFKNKVINITRSLSCQYEEGEKRLRVVSPKTINSYRSIPFMGELEPMLSSLRVKQTLLKKQLGSRWRCSKELGDLVFTSSLGSPVIRHVAEKEINNIVKALNFQENVDAVNEQREPIAIAPIYPHAIRHTFCSRCFERGISPKIVQALMGHQHYSTTMDIYTHVTQQSIFSEVEKFGSALQNVSDAQCSLPTSNALIPNSYTPTA